MSNITKYLTKVNFNSSTNKQNKYIVVHYTANNGDTAMNNAKYFYSENRGASAHYFVDENEVVQVVEDKNIAWHCGTTGTYKHSECRNTNSIGIEMCSRQSLNGTYYIKDEVVARTQDLIKYLMETYNISIDNVVRHYDVTGKSCPATHVNSAIWSDFKNALTVTTTVDTSNLTKIEGTSVATVEQMKNYLNTKNPLAESTFGDLAQLYFDEGNIEGIRGDIAFAQACHETGFFKFGGDVLPEQNNFCGLGATGNGVKGNSFDTPQIGIQAQIQHLKAYVNTESLVQKCVDPRFTYVERGTAPYVEWLGQKENPQGKGWATAVDYGNKVLSCLNDILDTEKSMTTDENVVNEFIVPEWAEYSVQWAKDNGIIFGDGNGDFKLGDNVSRMEMCVFLERVFGKLNSNF